MDDIQARLTETSENCLKAHSAWAEKKKDLKAQGDLASAIHELRKVSSRLEIELALSERDQMAAKPIPIPSHRSNPNKGKKVAQSEAVSAEDGSPVVESKPRRRRAPKKTSDQE